jgi:hypothetical protein
MIPVSARNIEFVGHSDQGGRGDGVQVMVHKGHAFVGHMFSDGFTVVDVRDPKHPRPVKFVAAPPNSRAFHLQRLQRRDDDHDNGTIRNGFVIVGCAAGTMQLRVFLDPGRQDLPLRHSAVQEQEAGHLNH